MQPQTLFILTFTNALLAPAFPLPVPNAITKAAGHISSTAEDAKVKLRSAEPMGGQALGALEKPKVAKVAGIAGNNDYTAEDAEFYVRSVEATGSL